MLFSKPSALIAVLALCAGFSGGFYAAPYLNGENPALDKLITPIDSPHQSEPIGMFTPQGKFVAVPLPSAGKNYCHDAVKNKEWQGMRLKYADDLGILHLYALRVGLCQSVDEGKIDLDSAIDIFNIEHQKLWRERFEQEQHDKAKKKVAA